MYEVTTVLTFIPDFNSALVEESLQQIGLSAAKAAYSEVHDPMLKEVSEYPPPRSGQVKWVSDAQRRWAHWAYMAGILPYTRSFNYQRGWALSEPKEKGGMITVILSNSNLHNYRDQDYLPFVGGGFMKGNTNSWQQPFHTDWGWKRSQPIAAGWFEAYLEVFVKELAKRSPLVAGTVFAVDIK